MTYTATRPTRLLLVGGDAADADALASLLRAAATFDVARTTGLAEALAYLDTATPDCAVSTSRRRTRTASTSSRRSRPVPRQSRSSR